MSLLPSTSGGGIVKFWHLAAVLALVGLGSAVSTVVRNPGEPIGPDVGGGIFAFLAMAVITVMLFRVDALNVRLDRSGPVVPAEDPAVPAGTRWTLDQIAAVLALHVEPMNGVVFADQRTGTIRVMIDPPTAITRRSGQEDRRVGETRTSSGESFIGQWTRIQLRPGNAPQLKSRSSNVYARLNQVGRMVPVWASLRFGDRESTRQTRNVVLAGHGPPISFRFDSGELYQAVDAIAVRAGWVSAADVAAQPVDPKTRHEVRSVERTSSTSSVSSSTSSASATPAADVHLSPEEVQARMEAVRRGAAEAASKDSAGLSKIMSLVGGGILAGCLIGTILGLIFGMPWWASFIIIGSGLLFCLIFVLPVWVLFGTPWRPKQA